MTQTQASTSHPSKPQATRNGLPPQLSKWRVCKWTDVLEKLLSLPIQDAQATFETSGLVLYIPKVELPTPGQLQAWTGLSQERLEIDWYVSGALGRTLLDHARSSRQPLGGKPPALQWLRLPMALRGIHQFMDPASASAKRPSLWLNLFLVTTEKNPSPVGDKDVTPSERDVQESARQVASTGLRRVVCVRPPVLGLKLELDSQPFTPGQIDSNSGGEFWIAQ